MSGVFEVAAAVHAAMPVRGVFPAVGKVTDCHGSSDGSGALVSLYGLLVRVNGRVEDCLWSGALLTEMRVRGLPAESLVGRDVKVESLGGDYVVAYTINGSDG